MTVRHGLLALLAGGASHGYELKQAFEERTGSLWPLNIGQVYTTLSRLERDGLVAGLDGGPRDRRPYELTDAGRAELDDWVLRPVDQAGGRDELVVKVLMALATPGVDGPSVLQHHRRALVEEMQRYTRLRAGADPAADLDWLLTVDALVLRAEAMVRWLDQCEARTARARRAPGPSRGARPRAGKSSTTEAEATP
ncbi:MAG: PadR family transcriptional regulator [Acidimicrobiales bacterium]